MSSTDFQAAETGNIVTAFGAGLGLANADVNGNFSHNFFAATGGMNVVDLYNGNPDMALTLAWTGFIGSTGVPEPGTIGLLAIGLLGIGIARPRRRQG